MTHSDKIRGYLKLNPKARTKDIAAFVGCTPALVSTIRGRMGLTHFTGHFVPTRLTTANAKFLAIQAAGANVSINQMVNAIISDAIYDSTASRTTQEAQP